VRQVARAVGCPHVIQRGGCRQDHSWMSLSGSDVRKVIIADVHFGSDVKTVQAYAIWMSVCR
jgi:hypothetical protein